MEEESKTKFSMNVEFSFSFKKCKAVNLCVLSHVKTCGIIPSLTVRREKNGYKPSKYGRCSRFLSCIDMCYISGLFKIFVFLMIVRIEAFVMIS